MLCDAATASCGGLVARWASAPSHRCRSRPRAKHKPSSGDYTFFLKYFLENEIFLDNLKFFVLIFLENDCVFLENAISFFLPRR